jgi:dTDP-4-dehydrorhamnose 3,5-epimerase
VRFETTPLPGAWLVELDPVRDERGFFARAWCRSEFEAHGLEGRLVQANVSYNRVAGTLRGLHYQTAPHEETKLIRCTRGALYSVIVDVRSGSPTRGKWFGVELTAENRRAIYVPRGFAHGYLALTDHAEAFYQVSEYYAPSSERGIRYDDPAIGIHWPGEVRVVSLKDRSWPDFVP